MIDGDSVVARLCAAGMAIDGDAAAAGALFRQAWDARCDDYEASIAAHFLARHQPSLGDTLHWNRVAAEHAEAVADGRAKPLLASLYLNLADSYLVLGHAAEAAEVAERAVAALQFLPADGYREFVSHGLQRLRARIPQLDIKVCGAMRLLLAGLAVTGLLARGAGAQSPPHQPAAMTPVGTWRGTSVCLVRPSACNDEIVVYRIAHAKSADSLTLDARKIVRGEEQEMGVLTCRFTSPSGPLTCAIPRGTWLFRVRRDSLVGELRLPDNTKFRDVRAIRSP